MQLSHYLVNMFRIVVFSTSEIEAFPQICKHLFLFLGKNLLVVVFPKRKFGLMIGCPTISGWSLLLTYFTNGYVLILNYFSCVCLITFQCASVYYFSFYPPSELLSIFSPFTFPHCFYFVFQLYKYCCPFGSVINGLFHWTQWTVWQAVDSDPYFVRSVLRKYSSEAYSIHMQC